MLSVWLLHKTRKFIMNDTNLPFYGFSTDAAKKSWKINEILIRLIAGVERDIEIVTSTPKFGKIMEISFSKHRNFHITMDHDSGYISHHQESNSDSSLENISDAIRDPSSCRPIYLSEDALLEKPEICTKTITVSRGSRDDEETRKFGTDFERDDFTESKNIFLSPDTILSSSVVSQQTTYSEFDDTQSNTSMEIPYSNPIIVENVDTCISDLQCNSIGSNLRTSNTAGLVYQDISPTGNCVQSEIESNFCLTAENGESDNGSTLSDITNKCNSAKNKESKKRLTLIFSKDNKENVYRVKRKYQSISPDKDASTEKNMSLDENLASENILIPACIKIGTEAKEFNSLDYSDSVDNNVCPEKDLDLEQIEITVNNEIEETNEMDSSDGIGKELILKKELDLDEIVLQQENVEYIPACTPQERKVLLDIPENKIEGQMGCIQQSCPLAVTPRKKIENSFDPNVSPDLFENEEILEEVKKDSQQPLNYIAEERYVIRKDQRFLKRAQNSLKGVLPPHSITVVHMSVDEMLNRLETNKEYFWTSSKVDEQINSENGDDKLNVSDETIATGESKSLLIVGNKDCVKSKWPRILLERYHGLHHNRNKLSEELEELCLKYGQRYVGAETQSSCTVFESNFVSPTKRKQTKQRWAVKSPGRRLSHLAKRRITFSSANLQGGASSSFLGSRARQILVDAKKLDILNRRRSPRKSPRKNLRRTPRKTPSKSPRVKSRTPSSSAKKKLAMRFRELTGEIEKTIPSTSSEKSVFLSKRVLFHSPEPDNKLNIFQPSTSGLSVFESELKNPGTKRALFISPSKKSPLKNSPYKRSPFKRLDLGAEKKRKRLDCDDMPPSKLARSMSMDVRPSECEVTTKFNRTKSDMNICLNRTQSGELTAVHKKKLQWVVYEALRSQNITISHPQFKIFASILARVTRRFLPNLSSNGPKECGTTEKMLRVARVHVYAVVKGKSVDEIINEHLKNKARYVKPQGYVGLEAFKERKNLETSSKENIIRTQFDRQDSLDKKRLELLSKPKACVENRIDRIRKVINFGDDNR